MPLNIVSITGADDKVLPAELAALSARYTNPITPEWAILYFPEKEGTPRNPSAAWREAFLALGLPFRGRLREGAESYAKALANDILR